MPKRFTEEELKNKIKEIDSNFILDALYDFKNYKNNNSILKLKHSCGRIIEMSLKILQEGSKLCPCEKSNTRKENYLKNKISGRGQYLLKDNYLNEIFSDPEYELINNPVYSGNNKNKIEIKHLKCGTVYKTTPNRFQQGQRCPFCANYKRCGAIPGYGAEQIKNYLEKNNLLLNLEKKFEDLKDKKHLLFDFEDIYNNIIEFDGQQHFVPGKRRI